MTFALALGIAMPAPAANNLPVFVEGQKIAEPALVKNGVSYLPMRAIYEALGAKVQWDAKNQRVIAAEADGTWTEIPLKGDEMTVHYSANGTGTYGLTEQRPFSQRGKVYLPVRLISDAMGYEVDYNKQRIAIAAPKLTYKDANGGVYTLNKLSGELTLSLNGKTQKLGELAMLSSRGFNYASLSYFTVELTKNGNYLLTGNGIYFGGITQQLYMYAWVPKAGGEAVAVYTAKLMTVAPEPIWVGDVLWLSGQSGTFSVNDKTGAVTEYDVGSCYWTDGRFMLVGNGCDFSVYDIKTAEYTDMEEELVTPEVKAQAETDLQALGKWRSRLDEMYWQNFGVENPVDPWPYLYFSLCCPYDDDVGAGWETKQYTLTYTLPQ